MEQLPPEVIIQYALFLDLDSISSLCQTCRYFNDVCNTEYFWRERTLRDWYGAPDWSTYKITKPENQTWKEHYRSWTELPIMGSIAENKLFFIRKLVPFQVSERVWTPVPCMLLSKTEMKAIIEKLSKLLDLSEHNDDDYDLAKYCEIIQSGLMRLGHYLPDCHNP